MSMHFRRIYRVVQPRLSQQQSKSDSMFIFWPMCSAASYLTATSSARQVGASTSESQSPLSVPLDQPLTANVDEQQQHPANPSPTYTTLTPVRSAEVSPCLIDYFYVWSCLTRFFSLQPQPQNTEVDERIEVAQIMGQLKQGECNSFRLAYITLACSYRLGGCPSSSAATITNGRCQCEHQPDHR